MNPLQQPGSLLSGSFPLKLHIMLDELEDREDSSIVSWQPHGRCFVVHKRREFVESIMPKYFSMSKFASFQRQLNLYGFERITHGTDIRGYYHPHFLRGERDMCKNIIRQQVKGTGVRKPASPEKEPNFYQMEYMPALSPSLVNTKNCTTATSEEMMVEQRTPGTAYAPLQLGLGPIQPLEHSRTSSETVGNIVTNTQALLPSPVNINNCTTATSEEMMVEQRTPGTAYAPLQLGLGPIQPLEHSRTSCETVGNIVTNTQGASDALQEQIMSSLKHIQLHMNPFLASHYAQQLLLIGNGALNPALMAFAQSNASISPANLPVATLSQPIQLSATEHPSQRIGLQRSSESVRGSENICKEPQRSFIVNQDEHHDFNQCQSAEQGEDDEFFDAVLELCNAE